MFEFDPERYGPRFAELVRGDRYRELGPGQPDPDARPALEALTREAAFAHARIVDDEMAQLCVSGVWLVHDYLDQSHRISQSVETTSGSFWHGIMHRREPDYSNAKYWFRRTAGHPVFGPLAQAARELAQASQADGASALAAESKWDPSAFVDRCAAAEPNSPGEQLCRRIQQWEWELLFDHCYRAALEGGRSSR